MGLAFPKPVRPEKGPRKPLRARKPMKRAAGPKAKRWGIAWKRPRRLDGPGSDPAYIQWLHEVPCVVPATVPGADACQGRVHACHEGERKPGMGMKSPDQSAFSMCAHHHLAAWTNHRGCFAGWSKEQRREWGDARGAESRALYLSHGGRRSR